MVIVFDLDDTLYDEIDFVKSGFKEISKYLNDEKYYDFMINEFYQKGSGKIFDKLIDSFDLDISLEKLIEIYRFHKPKIVLDKDSKELLDFVKDYNTALISDGHYIMQENKFYALGLQRYIDYPIFTDFYHTKKPKLQPFKMVMQRFKNKRYFYISDNPKKDFIAPNKLGWTTIRYKNPVGIYKDIKSDADFEVYNKIEILNILKRVKNA
jgi:putative hydrolase of the HAD superfamily